MVEKKMPLSVVVPTFNPKKQRWANLLSSRPVRSIYIVRSCPKKAEDTGEMAQKL